MTRRHTLIAQHWRESHWTRPDWTGPDHTPPKAGSQWTDMAQTGPDPASQTGTNGGDPSGGPKRAEVDQFTIRTLIRTKR